MIHSRTKKHRSKISFTLAWIIFFQAMLPLKGLALTSGPSQPEFNSFEPVGTTQMVDPFTGNFVYNIPLFELPGPDGGYPFNLSYKPDGNINSESGPFGYGWTINPGVISRNVRGIPDDHKGDAILETTSIKDNWTIGADFAPNIELAGLTGVNASFGLYYNNYRGVGVNLAAGVSLPLGNEDSGNSLGLNASFDSQEGFDVSPSIGIGGILKANTSINSRRGMSGLSLSLGAPLGKDKVTEEEKDGKVTKTSERVKSGSSMSFFGSNISLAGGSHSPSLNMPWNSFSLNGKVRLGASLFSIFGNASVGGSFSRQSLKNKGKEQKIDGYGYMFLEESLDKEDEKILLDFSREKDGPITKRSPNLGIPMTTPDVFSASGQGMAGMFRPYRSDIGIVYDSKVSSQGGGGSFSFDAPVLHVGGSGSISFSSNKSGKWDTNVDKFDFKTEGLLPNGKINNSYEKYYFKTQGEKVSEATDVIEKYVGGEEPMRFDVNYLNANPTYKNKEGKNVESDEVNDQAISTQRDGERKPRGLVIQDFNNVEAPSIPLLDVEYYDREIRSSDNSNSSIFVNPSDLERSGSELVHLKPDHIAGFISTDTKGVRYAYGIPAYNKVEENYVFSVPNSSVKACHPLVDLPLNSNKTKINYEINGTDEFIKHTKKPAFAHSYLLTSVLGSDYIDVNNNGPSVEDLGYWVKFNYSKIHDDYKWRSPYIQAFADSGVKAKKNDDKGSFTYGEKEIWMLGTVETKTHIAVFITEERKDALEAVKKFSNAISDPER